MQIDLAESDESILAAFDAMKHLREFDDAKSFLLRVRELQKDGYLLACVVTDGRVVAVAGFRIAEKIAWLSLEEARWRTFFSLAHIEPLNLVYEEVVESIPRAVEKVARFVGEEVNIDKLPEPQNVRMSSPLNEAFIERFRREFENG